MNPFLLPAGYVQIAFSGGRTSAFLLHEILEANGPLPERVIVTFQNTGREMPETLDFIAEVGRRWQVPIVWLEYQPEEPGYQVVDRARAASNGEPFEALIRKRKFLPNVMARFCTTELKIRTVKKYLMSQGWQRWTNCVGIRADEPHRLNKPPPKERWSVWTPLATAGVTKREVTDFWARQPFDLQLVNVAGVTPMGNCDGCFLKSEANVARLAATHPERHAWWERMEALATELSNAKGMTPGRGAWFSKRYSRSELRRFMESQGELALENEGVLCQANEGECFG